MPTREEVESLLANTTRAATFDVHPIRGARMEELSQRLFDEYYRSFVPPDVVLANHRTLAEKMASCRLLDLDRQEPTAAGLLLLGINPTYHLPGATVMLLRFEGTNMAERPVDEFVASGDLRTIVDEMFTKIRVYNRVRPVAIDSLKERQAADYPEVALREFVLNAIIHRDYQSNAPVRVNWFDDRVEIQNPGGTYGQVSRYNLAQRSDYRNPVLAEAMKNLGYVNKFGYGIQRATLALVANGNPIPEFDIDDRGFLVIVRRGVS